MECCNKTKERADTEKRALINRLKRIEGQIRGLEKMVEENAYCIDIVTQAHAASSAISSFEKELLASHIKTCLIADISVGKRESVDELIETLEKLIRG